MCTPAVCIRQLAYAYPDGKMALRGINLQIGPHEVVGLIGPNGAGKSTVLMHLNGLLPQPGVAPPKIDGRTSLERLDKRADGDLPSGVWIEGVKVDASSLVQARQKVGLLFQDPDDQLFCATVLEDVSFGPRCRGIATDKAHRLAREQLALVGLGGFDHRSPTRLSAGEKKRACLAGVLACQPSILALDEPTSNLDPRGRRQLVDLLRTLPQAKIIATHDLDLVTTLCHRAVVLDEGLIQADGPAKSILADQSLLRAHGLDISLDSGVH